MKPTLKFTLYVLPAFVMILFSCKKELLPPGYLNSAPVAHAGVDQTVTLPLITTSLNGSGSTDPEKNIVGYVWTKISGASLFKTSKGAILEKVNIGIGPNLFELTVTDAGGLSSKDTIKVTLKTEAPALSLCNDSHRSEINAELIPIGALSQTRSFITSVSIGNKIFYAGGPRSSRVDIYDVVTHQWSTAELSVPRQQIASVAAGNKVFFAGGIYYEDADNAHFFATVDIYDVATNTWSVDSLSESGYDMAAAAIGNKVFFTSGNKVDIYDLVTNTWSTARLSEARTRVTAVTADNKVFIAGGDNFRPSNKIDIYDDLTKSWSVSTLNEARYNMAGIAVADKIYWAGGFKTDLSKNEYQVPSCTVEIKDIHSQSSSLASLFRARGFYIDESQNAVVKDNKIIFFTGSIFRSESLNRFDIYDISTNAWSIGVLPQYIERASIISVNNTIYIAGGYINGDLSNQVYKLEF